MSPRERFDRLYNRIMTAAENGDEGTVTNFTPMALSAYSMLDTVDADARYHAALIKLHTGDIAVIGGAEVFALFLDRVGRIELTEVHAAPAGDAIVPSFGPEWHEIAREDHPAESDRPAYSFVTLERAP